MRDDVSVNPYSAVWHWYSDTAGAVWHQVVELCAAYPGGAATILLGLWAAGALAAGEPEGRPSGSL